MEHNSRDFCSNIPFSFIFYFRLGLSYSSNGGLNIMFRRKPYKNVVAMEKNDLLLSFVSFVRLVHASGFRSFGGEANNYFARFVSFSHSNVSIYGFSRQFWRRLSDNIRRRCQFQSVNTHNARADQDMQLVSRVWYDVICVILRVQSEAWKFGSDRKDIVPNLVEYFVFLQQAKKFLCNKHFCHGLCVYLPVLILLQLVLKFTIHAY